MKFYLNTVSPLVWEFLNYLMDVPELRDFKLVGGTSLSLQLGHRRSVDIDLFTDAVYGSIDFEEIENVLTQLFPYFDKLSLETSGIGSSYFIGKSKNETVKLDLFYTEEFVFPHIVKSNIRMADPKEIAAMKLEVIAQGGRKKDFWDLHELLETYSLDEMIGFYMQRNPYSYSESELKTQLKNFSLADDDFTPNCYRGKIWELIKLDFEELVDNSNI